MNDIINDLSGAGRMISPAEAAALTAEFRREKDNILIPILRDKGIIPISETFDRSFFEMLLNETGCAGLRIYLGMDAGRRIRLLVVGVDSANQDIIPSTAGAVQEVASEGYILEEGQRCPDYCPGISPMNAG